MNMFEVRKAASGYWWRLKGNNGEILCHSEMFSTKQSALDGIAVVKRIASTASIVDLT
ncbi:YegP family protein [Paracoccus yeei]|uniref:YegP family protein n=2 Tax=Paracoccus yeei TaxID=147645 RepID=UPI0009DE3D34|nr:DUF1508 domain-containing protein [Paracoccus yeei]